MSWMRWYRTPAPGWAVESMEGELDRYKASAGTDGVSKLQVALNNAKTRASMMRSAASLRDARTILDPYGIGLDLNRAESLLRPAIAQADAAYLRDHAT